MVRRVSVPIFGPLEKFPHLRVLAMLFGNSTLDSVLPVSLRVALVVSASIASTFGNLFVLVIFTMSVRDRRSSKNNRYRVIDIIIASLAIAALCRGLLLGPIQAACAITGDWSLGNSLCQFQAFLEVTLRNAIIWYLSLLSIERYTKHIIPHDYLVTFSPLTINIILPGILLIVIVQVTGPLYGWGKYDYIEDAFLCGSATTSPFGCSYAIYLLCFLIFPPLSVIVLNGILLSSRMCKRSLVTAKRDISSGNSRMLSAENEIRSLLLLTVLFVLFTVPRSVVDAALMCRGPQHWMSVLVFTIYFLDSLTDLLLPTIWLGMHPKARTILWEALKKRDSHALDIGMTELNL